MNAELILESVLISRLIHTVKCTMDGNRGCVASLDNLPPPYGPPFTLVDRKRDPVKMDEAARGEDGTMDGNDELFPFFIFSFLSRFYIILSFN